MHPRLISRAFAGPVGRAGTPCPQPGHSLLGKGNPRRPSGPIYASAGGLILVSTIARLVWSHFASRLRTRRSPACPSEFVVSTALRHQLPDFLAAGPADSNWRKFLRSRLDPDQMQGARLAA